MLKNYNFSFFAILSMICFGSIFVPQIAYACKSGGESCSVNSDCCKNYCTYAGTCSYGHSEALPQTQNSQLDISASFAVVSSPSSNYEYSNNSKSKIDLQPTPVDDTCCPAGSPWLRVTTNQCFSSYSDCHDTNGGGWSCQQVNACRSPKMLDES